MDPLRIRTAVVFSRKVSDVNVSLVQYVLRAPAAPPQRFPALLRLPLPLQPPRPPCDLELDLALFLALGFLWLRLVADLS